MNEAAVGQQHLAELDDDIGWLRPLHLLGLTPVVDRLGL